MATGSSSATTDHDPAHVHITGAAQAKINLPGAAGVPEVVFSVGIKRADMGRLLSTVTERRNDLLCERERIHRRGI
jgi:hypothetical protein